MHLIHHGKKVTVIVLGDFPVTLLLRSVKKKIHISNDFGKKVLVAVPLVHSKLSLTSTVVFASVEI